MNRNGIINIVLAGILHLPALTACSTYRHLHGKEAVHNLIVFYDPTIGNEQLLKATKEYGSEVIYEYKNFNSIAVTVPSKHTTLKAMEFYKKVNGVLSVTEDRKMKLH